MHDSKTNQLNRASRLRRIAIGAAGLFLAGLVILQATTAFLSQADGHMPVQASGIIQVTDVAIASELGGRIAEILVSEGDTVAAGDVIVRLDTAVLDAQIEAGRAAVAMAEAGLAQAKAGARPGQIVVAEAQLAQAQAALVAASQAVSDTQALLENPQDIRLQIAVTLAQAQAAQHRVTQAVALKDAAEIAKNTFDDAQARANELGGEGRRKILVSSGSVDQLPGQLPPEIAERLPELDDGVYTFGNLELHLHDGTYELYKWINISIPLDLHLAPNQWWQAWVGVNAATAAQEGIEASLAHLYAQQAHPQSIEVKADEARSMQAQAEAQVALAQAQVDGLKAGAVEEQIAALEARVAQAQAVLRSLEIQRATLEIAAPIDGVVIDVVAHQGEVAARGATLLTVADLSEVRLVVYLPETQIGDVRLGQPARVTADSFPDRVYAGLVTHIADRAEYTPRNVATQEERVNLVFAVEIRLANDDRTLKPGMPADAAFGD